MSKKMYGTKEWAKDSLNFITGCSHDCRYCYSKAYALKYGRATPESWKNEIVREYRLKKKCKKYDGRVMFPSSHDISPEHLNGSVRFLRNILEAGNEVLVVSKPHLECIERICDEFGVYKDKILFRFTIGSSSSAVLKFWEPEAPSFEERLECLRLAYDNGYKTSVSCEPMLDGNIDDVVRCVMPYVTDAVWIGKANYLLERVELNGHYDEEMLLRIRELHEWQTDDNIKRLYQRYKDNEQIKWKESIKKIVGIPIPREKGLDI